MDYEPVPIISKEYPTLVIPLLDSAMYSIDIVVFDWRFYKNAPDRSITLFNNAVARAVARGIRVRCLVQNESVVRSLKQIGCDARMIQSKRILHTKLLIVDKNKVVLGSHNYTQSAFESNYEASIFVVLASKQNALVRYFDNLFGL